MLNGRWPVASHLLVYLSNLYLVMETLDRTRIQLSHYAAHCLCFPAHLSLDTRLLCYFLWIPLPSRTCSCTIWLCLGKTHAVPCFTVTRPASISPAQNLAGSLVGSSNPKNPFGDPIVGLPQIRNVMNDEPAGWISGSGSGVHAYARDVENVTMMVQCLLVYIGGK